MLIKLYTKQFSAHFKEIKCVNKGTSRKSTHLHGIVQQLVLELFDVEDLLEEVVELLLAHHFVAEHGGGQPLPGPPRLVVWRRK